MTDESNADEPTNKRERSPSFPYLDLDTSVELVGKLYLGAKMNEVRLSDLADAWGMTPKSGSLLRYIAALSQFGLLTSTGSGDARRFKVSTAARRILEDGRPGVREKLCADAALQPKLVRGLFLGEDGMHHWGHDRPVDSIAESSLKFDMNFTSEAARRFLSVYDTTIKHIVDGTIVPDGAATEDDGVGEDASTENAIVPQVVVAAPQRNEPIRLASPAPFGSTNPTPAPTSTPAAASTPAVAASPLASDLLTGELNVVKFKSEADGTLTIAATLNADGLDILEEKIKAFRMLIG